MQQNVANIPEQYYYGARYYDPKTSIWLGVDPMADKYPGLSPFVYCADNPVMLMDPDGRDWYKDTDGSIQFCPKLNSENAKSHLKKGQTYIGEQHTEKTKNGSANYRKDGSIFYSNLNDGLKRLDYNSRKYNGKEELGVITKDGGMLVTPDYKNTDNECNPIVYGYQWQGGNLIDKQGKLFEVEASVHTHYADGVNSQPSGTGQWGEGDLQTFSAYTPNKPVITMGRNGYLYGLLGRYTSSGPQPQWAWLKQSGIAKVASFLNGKNIRSFYQGQSLKMRK